ncbi:CAP domain-containing protein [Sansalvadorimonas verongulae]|uniref:CAP domain-containing protein n=1 Tax=Sansalvadorimonas verongulae TaxID=2172824 RepID=UPI0012BD4904|nr:CAP domain-containing protein [Sansalvadorimonas verongulae]MTI14455.1 CAP domain-containing protein [Sansalvadorimonas verongulae]
MLLKGFLWLVVCCAVAIGAAADTDDSAVALEFINQARSGLQPLSCHPLLSKVAWHHSRYMAANNSRGHREQEDCPEFTGVTCAERLVTSGHPSRMYIENLSTGQLSWQHSVQELMSAIYHRLGFLSFYIDSIGLARATAIHKAYSKERKPFYSYVMTYSGYELLCAKGISGDVNTICSDTNITVDSRELYKTIDEPALKSVEFVVYPWNEQQGVVPYFINNEQPSPIAGKDIVGQPFSIHFNPAKFYGVPILVLKVELVSEQQEVINLLPGMNKATDPNRKFTAFDFAWFPEEPLEDNTQYTVRLLVVIGRKPQPISWSFHTGTSN